MNDTARSAALAPIGRVRDVQPGRPCRPALGFLLTLVLSGCAARYIHLHDEAIAEEMAAAPDVGDDEAKLQRETASPAAAQLR